MATTSKKTQAHMDQANRSRLRALYNAAMAAWTLLMTAVDGGRNNPN